MALTLAHRRVWGGRSRRGILFWLLFSVAGLFPGVVFWLVFATTFTQADVITSPRFLPAFAVVILLPSAAWAASLSCLFRSRLIIIAPIVGAVSAFAVHFLSGWAWPHGNPFLLVGCECLAWVLPQVILGACMLERIPTPGHCPDCDYDLAGPAIPTVCPECGRKVITA